jgi:hypothetical protein
MNSINPNFFIYIGISIIFVVLLIVIVIQHFKLKKLQRPRYGFLGKALVVFTFLGMLSGTIYLGTFLNESNQSTETINADTEIRLTITYFEVVKPFVYSFQVIPIIDGIQWGGGENFEFDVFWSVENNGEVKEFVETGVSIMNPSKITINLSKGENIVTAKIFIKSRVIDESVVINID